MDLATQVRRDDPGRCLSYTQGMEHDFTFRFSREFVWGGWRPQLLRQWLLCLVFVIAFGWLGILLYGRLDPYIIFTLCGMAVVLPLVIYLKFRRFVEVSMEFWENQSPDGTIRFRLDGEGITLDVGASMSRFKWEGAHRLRRYKDVWMLEVLKDQFLPFPARSAPPEAAEFLVERCRSAGVRV